MRPRRPPDALTLNVLATGGPLLVPTDPASGPSHARAFGDPDSRFATLAGIDVHHKVAGPDDAPAVVLLHHFHGNVATWRHVQRGLADHYRVAAFDRPAFGLTERPRRRTWNGANPYTRETSARLTVELLDELGMDQAVLIGSSAGGTVALEAYAQAPERVRALVLVAPAITGDVGPPAFLRPLLRHPQLRRLGPRIIRRAAGEITLERVAGSWSDPSRATADDVAAYTVPMQAEGWHAGYWEVFAAEPPPDLSALLPRIAVPTLVVTGDQDRVVSPHLSRRTAAAIPGAAYVEIPGCGHTPQEECPDAFEEAVRDFLRRLPDEA